MKFFISDRKLWQTQDGEIVEDSDPRKSGASLFLPKGGTLPLAEAERLGLAPKAEPEPGAATVTENPEATEDAAQDTEEKAIEAPAENKAIRSPEENKSIEPKRKRKKAA